MGINCKNNILSDSNADKTMIECLSNYLSPLNVYFSQLMSRIASISTDELILASSLISYWTERGHVCINLNVFSEYPIADCFESSLKQTDTSINFVCPPIDRWRDLLLQSAVVGRPGEKKPLILDHNDRLYLYRYFQYERQLADLLIKRSQQDVTNLYISGLSQFLDRLFPKTSYDIKISPQRKAVEIAIKKKLCIISGGPGTGKTTVAAKIIAALIHVSENMPRIDITAPTGKAAQRLQESIINAKNSLNCSDEIKSAMPQHAMTIHRLLGSIHRSPYFKYNFDNKLPSDVVIVDEASMIDIALMNKLITALKPEARLIILGDKDQLASVDPGSVLGDICGKHKISNSSPINSCIVYLSKNYRFGENSGVYKLAKAVNQGNLSDAEKFLNDLSLYPEIKWTDITDIKRPKISLQKDFIQFHENYHQSKTPADALTALNQFRILCAVRKGPFGVEYINNCIREILISKGLIQSNKQWYHGRPVMITKNDAAIGLYNGDIGIIFKDKNDHNSLKAFFIGPDNSITKYLPARLPDHETVYAMTVHKSQGSEFNHVLFILPDTLSKVLTRELIYTGLTRTRKHIHIWGAQSIIRAAIKNQINRQSGLSDALWHQREII